MTKRQSILLDILLKDFTIPEYKGNAGMVNINKVISGNDKLKGLTESELKKILYIIRKEQIKIGINLITGESIFLTYDSHINDFLENGGFKEIRRKELNKLIVKRIGIVITIATFILLIYSTFFQETLQNEPLELKKEVHLEEESQTKTSMDSLNNHYHKSNQEKTQIDSLK